MLNCHVIYSCYFIKQDMTFNKRPMSHFIMSHNEHSKKYLNYTFLIIYLYQAGYVMSFNKVSNSDRRL